METPGERDLHALSAAELFRPIGRTRIEQIGELASVFEVGAGHVLVQRGERSEHLFALIEGVARAEVPTSQGSHFLPVTAPEVCGWPALVYPYTQIATVSAATECRVAEIPIQQLRALMEGDPLLQAAVHHQLAVIALQRIDAVMSLLQGQEPFSYSAPA